MNLFNFKIEKNIPLPEHQRGRRNGSGKNQMILKSMEVGDSIFIKNGNQVKVANLFQVAAKSLGTGMKIATRKVEGGVRVWRVK